MVSRMVTYTGVTFDQNETAGESALELDAVSDNAMNAQTSRIPITYGVGVLVHSRTMSSCTELKSS